MTFLLSLKAPAALDPKSHFNRVLVLVQRSRQVGADVCFGQLHTDHSLGRLGTER